MGLDPWVDRGTCPPYFLKWKGRPVFCPPHFFGGRHFCTNAHDIFVKFSRLILMKIITIVAIRCQRLRLKCTKFIFG